MPPAFVAGALEPANAYQLNERERRHQGEAGVAGDEIDAVDGEPAFRCQAAGVGGRIGAIVRGKDILAAPALQYPRQPALSDSGTARARRTW